MKRKIHQQFFKVRITEQEELPGMYKINVYYKGDHDFYNQMISTAREERALLTYKPMSFMMKFIWREKYLFYFEQDKGTSSKYPQWKVDQLLRNEIENVPIAHPEDLPGMERGIAELLDFFANEEMKK